MKKNKISIGRHGKAILGFLCMCIFFGGCGQEQDLVLYADEKEEVIPEQIQELPDIPKEQGNLSSEEAAVTEKTVEDAEPEMIYVEVCGAILCPGVYEMERDSRIFQIVEKAGGLLPEAASGYVNQAKTLQDGEQIYFPTEAEVEEEKTSGTFRQTEDGDPVEQSSPDFQSGGKININTADEAALVTLTGIGPAKAQAIIQYREQHGRFQSIEELLQVQGIKEGTFSKIKEEIVIE